MYIVKNACKSIIRAKGRTVVIFILVFLIAVSSCVALSVRNSAQTAKAAAYDALSITAQISTNRQSIMGRGNFDRDSMMNQLSQALTLDEMNYYAKSEFVDHFYYSMSVGLNVSEDFSVYETSSSIGFGSSKFGGMGGKSSADLTVIGYSSHDAMTGFLSGENVICDGTVFDQGSADNTCMISYELAVLNNLSVGDTFLLHNPAKEDQCYEMTVCGIFENRTTDAYSNTVFTTYNSLSAIVKDTEKDAWESTNDRGVTTTTALRASTVGTYVFYTAENYKSFCTDVEAMGLDTNLNTVTSSDLSQYEKSIVPLESLSKFTMVFFLVVLLIGGSILVIFNMFTVREQKYEIGVLAAIGMKKGKVAVQFLTEAFLVTLAAVVIGTGVGAAVSNPVGNYLLQEQIASVQTDSAAVEQNFGGGFQGGNRVQSFGSMAGRPGTTQKVQYLDSLNASTDVTVLFSLMAISILLTLLASGIGMISVLCYEPLKILSER